MTTPLPPLSTLVELLEQATNLRVVKAFLKSKDIPSSIGSWPTLEAERLQPAINTGKLKISDIWEMLSEVEEYGNCHVFLYKCSSATAKTLIAQANVQEKAQSLGLSDLLKKPLLTTHPRLPTICSIRCEEGDGGSLSIKVVETRPTRKKGETEWRDGREFIEYKTINARAINVMRLSSTGLLEVRIQAHSSNSYFGDIERIWKDSLEEFFPREEFKPLSLANLKDKLLKNQKDLEGRLVVSDAKLRNDNGNIVTAATGKTQTNLMSDEGTAEVIEGFIKAGGFQDSTNICFKAQPDGTPSADLQVHLSGLRYEFIIAASCTKAEYEYVLAQLSNIGF